MKQSTRQIQHHHSPNNPGALYQRTLFFSPESSFFRPRHIRIQPKLTVNAPNDIYEKEADAMADRVMRMPDPQIHRKPLEEEEEVMTKLQASAVQRMCTECEEEEKLQRKPL